MSEFLQFATMAGVILEAGLVGRLLLRKEYATRPCWFAFAALLLVTSALEFIGWYTKLFTPGDYQFLYWKLTALEFAFGAACLGEQLHCRKLGLISGITIGICLGLLPTISGFAVVAWILTAGAIISLAIDPDSFLAAGLLILWLFPAICYLPEVPFWARGIPVFSWIIALLLWWFLPPVTVDCNESF